MLSNSLRNTLNNAHRDFVIKQIRNNISKTSTSTSKNDTIAKKQNKNLRKWIKISEYNNKRALSTLQTKTNPLIDDIALGSDKENSEFNATLKEILNEFNSKGRTADVLDITKAYKKVINNEKKRTGLTVLTAYKQLESQNNLTEDKIRVANILGWSVEFYHASLDEQSLYIYEKYMKDIDFTETNPDKVRDRLKDVKIIENTLYNFIQKNFSGKECYIPIIDLFNECTLKSSIGTAYEHIFRKNGTPNLDMFTMDKYKALVRYKTVLNSFVLPVTLAMFLAKKFDPELHRQARTVLNEVGNFHRVRRDFLNVFGNTAHDTATDIRNGQCSWLSVVALQRCNPEQVKLMKEHYGKNVDESVELIKQLYQDLGLPRTYEIYEEESFKIARAHAHQISKGLPHNLFFQMVEKIFRREIDFTPL